MSRENFAYSKYFWDLNKEALKETKKILKNPEHSEFPPRMIRLLSRCQKPEELFSIISKEGFIRTWPKIRNFWRKIDKNSDFRDWWQTIYEEILKEYGEKKKPEGKPASLFINIGKVIRETRIKKDLSQKDLALAVGMEQPDVSKIEDGKKNITVETLARICKVLNIREIKLED